MAFIQHLMMSPWGDSQRVWPIEASFPLFFLLFQYAAYLTLTTDTEKIDTIDII